MTPTDDREPAREPEIATGTLAEIYAQQGLYDRALEIYRRIERRRPDDPEIAGRIAALEKARDRREAEAGGDAARGDAGDIGAPGATPPPEPGPASPAGQRPEPPAEPRPEPPEESPPAGRTFRGDDEAFREWLESR